MNPNYSIPKPCNEDWGKMSTEQQGRHCQVCCKTVVDFSKKSSTEIVDFLQINTDKKICGRFRSEQLVPSAGSREPKSGSRYRIFFAALFFVFGGMLFTSCRTKEHGHKMGKVKIENSFTAQHNYNTLDTPSSRTKFKTDHQKTVPVCKKPVIAAADTIEPEIRIMGEVMYIPADTTKK
ncbi:MAG: hypothetical protein ABIQ40_05195 [Bacteroidia bacterium]